MKPKDQTLLLPGPDRWEVWPASANGSARREPIQRVESPSGAPAQRLGSVGLPVRHLHALPLWIIKSEAAPAAEMIEAQLERRALGGPHQVAPRTTRLLADETNRQLYLTTLLSPTLPEAVCLRTAPRFDPTPELYPLEPDRITLWVEEGRLVAAATRGPDLAYFQALATSAWDDTLAAELRCLLLQLLSEEVLTRCTGITLWHPLPEPDRERLERALQLPVSVSDRPAPRIAASGGGALVPQPVQDARGAAQRRRRFSRWLGIAALLYALALAAFGTHAFLKYRQILALRAELATDSAPLTAVRDTAARWRALEPALNPEQYPIERLFQAASLLPPEGVRLTLLEQRERSILLTGEARNAAAAFDFADKLKKSEQWTAYRWQIPQPRILPNGSTQFSIEGSRATPGAPADETADAR